MIYAQPGTDGAVVSFKKRYGHFINGEWTEPGETFDVINPSNREVLARVTHGTKQDVQDMEQEQKQDIHPFQHMGYRTYRR